MCPVLRLAVIRTVKVKGRTSILTSSIMHKNGFSGAGDPIGCKWARKAVRSYVILIITIAVQIGRAIAKLIARCLVSLKV